MKSFLLCCRWPILNGIYQRTAARKFAGAGRIIALCKGNTCRSPFLAACLQNAAAEKGIHLPPILSRGLLNQEGDSSSAVAIASAHKFGVNLSGHRSKSIYAELPDSRDVFLLVDPAHVDELTAWIGGTKPAVVYIGLMDREQPSAVIEDPFGNDEAMYDRTYARLTRATECLITQLK